MNSPLSEIYRLVKKEFAIEFRTPANLWTSAIFNVAATSAISFAAAREAPKAELAAGILVVLLIFSAVTVLPRIVLSEADQGTFDFLRLHFQPASIFWGKFVYSGLVQMVSVAIISVMFLGMVGVKVVHSDFLFAGLVLESLCFTGTLVLCGCLALAASSRWTLAGMLALPLLLPQAAASQGVLRYAFGAGFEKTAIMNLAALAAYVALLCAIGPHLMRFSALSGKSQVS